MDFKTLFNHKTLYPKRISLCSLVILEGPLTLVLALHRVVLILRLSYSDVSVVRMQIASLSCCILLLNLVLGVQYVSNTYFILSFRAREMDMDTNSMCSHPQETERRETRRQWELPFAGFTPQILAIPGSWGFHEVYHTGWKGPDCLSRHLLPS